MKRIIVAEDDRMTSHLLCAVLRRQGLEPDPVYDVSALFEACDRQPVPVAILLDMHMPGGSGLDSLRRLKEHPTTGSRPVIVVSGSHSPEEVAEARQLGAAQFIAKPVDPGVLIEALGRELTGE